MMFDEFGNLGALIEMDQNPDEIESILVTHNRTRRVQEIPNFLRAGQRAS